MVQSACGEKQTKRVPVPVSVSVCLCVLLCVWWSKAWRKLIPAIHTQFSLNRHRRRPHIHFTQLSHFVALSVFSTFILSHLSPSFVGLHHSAFSTQRICLAPRRSHHNRFHASVALRTWKLNLASRKRSAPRHRPSFHSIKLTIPTQPSACTLCCRDLHISFIRFSTLPALSLLRSRTYRSAQKCAQPIDPRLLTTGLSGSLLQRHSLVPTRNGMPRLSTLLSLKIISERHHPLQHQ